MKRKFSIKSRIETVWLLLMTAIFMTGCHLPDHSQISSDRSGENLQETGEQEEMNLITPSSEIEQLDNGFSMVRYDGDYGFDEFLAQGGASSDSEVVEYLTENLLLEQDFGNLLGNSFGCSTIAVRTSQGEMLFGRNFDWENCDAMVVASYPENGYASLSTVNMDFITQNISSDSVEAALQLDEVKTLAALYAPLDGLNEAGLAVSVNMIQDSANIEQDKDHPDITTTTAIRLLLNKAADVDDALELLSQYDLHGSMSMMIHFAIADSTGQSVAVEYVNNEMIVTQTPVLTNFYLAEGDKNGIGTEQSHERYDILMNRLEENPQMGIEDVRDALDSVSKDNFGEFESTEWSIVMNLNTGEVRYYHRENYEKNYTFQIEK